MGSFKDSESLMKIGQLQSCYGLREPKIDINAICNSTYFPIWNRARGGASQNARDVSLEEISAAAPRVMRGNQLDRFDRAHPELKEILFSETYGQAVYSSANVFLRKDHQV